MKNNHIDIIAEMACSHDGKVDLARKIIDGAGQAGSDVIQLQIWSLEHMMAPAHPKYELCKSIELTPDAWKEIVRYSRTYYSNMSIYTFVYEDQSVSFTESLGIDGYKLSPSDLSNPYVLDKVAATGKKINLSVGASSLSEIQAAILRIRKVSTAAITLMYGFQSFPTAIKSVHLNYMAKMKQLFELPMGYQDHCDADSPAAFWIPALSAGLGVSVIEKHITHDRSLKGVDHESALNPDEFKTFVHMIRELENGLGEAVPRAFSEEELNYRKFQKKSIVAARSLKAGELLRMSDIKFLRTALLGMPPDQAERVIDKTVRKDITIYENIREEDVV